MNESFKVINELMEKQGYVDFDELFVKATAVCIFVVVVFVVFSTFAVQFLFVMFLFACLFVSVFLNLSPHVGCHLPVPHVQKLQYNDLRSASHRQLLQNTPR